jgi:hypothetical protein
MTDAGDPARWSTASAPTPKEKQTMTTLHPRNHRDLLLAPVAAAIDLNLQRMREGSPRDVLQELELELDRPAARIDREERAQLVLEQALRTVDLHGWCAAISDDGCRLHLSGGSVSLDLGLGDGIIGYIRDGVRTRAA